MGWLSNIGNSIGNWFAPNVQQVQSSLKNIGTALQTIQPHNNTLSNNLLGPSAQTQTTQPPAPQPASSQTNSQPSTQSSQTPGNYTLNGTTYNQQGEIVNGPGPNSNPNSSGGTINTATSNIQPGSNFSPSSQTYTLGNGDTYDQQGNIVTPAGNNVQTNANQSFGGSDINSNTNSSNLGSTITNGDINSALNQNQTNETTLFNNLNNLFANQQNSTAAIQQYSQPGQQEIQQQGAVAQAQGQVGQQQLAINQLNEKAAGTFNPTGQPGIAPFLSGEAQNQLVGQQNQLLSSQINQQVAQTMLAYTQGNRQAAYTGAVQLFDASHQNLADAITMYQAAAPKNINTVYNPLTGEVNTQMINPLTGDTYNVDQGNIGSSQPLQNVSTQVNPYTGGLTITGTDAAGQGVSYSMNAQGQIIGSPQTSGVNGSTAAGGPGSLISSNINPQAVVGGYDLTNYAGGSSATGDYGQKVNSIYQNMPEINNPQDIQSYINSVSGNSPITGQMVMNASAEYGVDPKVMLSIMQQESSMGTTGMATSTYNPGNIGNNSDTGKETDYGNWQAGVNALAQNLSERNLNSQQSQGSNVQGAAITPQVIQQYVQSLPQFLQSSVKYLPDGTPYFDGNQLVSTAQQTAAQAYSAKIPYVNASNASKLQTITSAQKQIQDFQNIADSALSSYGWGAQYLNYAGLITKQFGGGTDLNKFNSYRTAAINVLQGLAGGENSGLRINQNEINQAISNFPIAQDTKTQADQKLATIINMFNNVTSTLIPGWIPPQ